MVLPKSFAMPSENLTSANQEFARRYPGESGRRQPVHTFYGGAHLFRADTCRKLGTLAERALTEHAPDAAALAEAVGVPANLAEVVYARVVEKLRREPIENYHIDFEDGYGIRPNDEEDAAARAAAEQVAVAMADGGSPAFLGIRIKPLNEEWKARAFRTLNLFLDTVLSRTGGRLPRNFVVTLPKITVVEQVLALADALEPFPGVGMELMIETPQSVLLLPKLVEAARGFCSAAHFGVYDYTASLGITASQQHLLHPACDFARSMMQLHLAGTGIWPVDGGTNILPLPVQPGAVQRAWKLHYGHVRHALDRGFYQGWDLHPAQLPARFAAVYAFFLEGREAASERLRNFIAQAARATEVGGVFDDAATGQGLVNYFLRAVNSGAIPESDLPGLTGLTLEQMCSGSCFRGVP
jgi:citrate lyase beta subunit